jgi:serine protease
MRRATAFIMFVLFCVPSAANAGTTDDPYRSIQWGLDVIHAEASWHASLGRGSVVAVIDTGVDPSHPDLEGRLLPGKDFVDDDDDASDQNGHGTLIAGIIGASTGNGVGVSATAPSTRILPVRALDADGTGTTSDVVDGIEWALGQGADVINLSLAQESEAGVLGSNILADRSVDRAIKDASRRGAVVVIAAGNDHDGGRAQTAYDATSPGAIVVGASTRGSKRAAYSNFGSGLDVLAPGGGSPTDPSRKGGCTDTNSIVSTWWDPASQRSAYGGGCGTSMAVGFVSGIAALLHAKGFDNARIVSKLKSSAVDLGADGRDDRTGYGRVDAARALGVKLATVAKPTPTVRTSLRASGSVSSTKASPHPSPSKPRVIQRVPSAAGDRISDVRGSSTPGRGPLVPVAALLVAIVTLSHIFRLAVRRPTR